VLSQSKNTMKACGGGGAGGGGGGGGGSDAHAPNRYAAATRPNNFFSIDILPSVALRVASATEHGGSNNVQV
jgi:hypothetical protein